MKVPRSATQSLNRRRQRCQQTRMVSLVATIAVLAPLSPAARVNSPIPTIRSCPSCGRASRRRGPTCPPIPTILAERRPPRRRPPACRRRLPPQSGRRRPCRPRHPCRPTNIHREVVSTCRKARSIAPRPPHLSRVKSKPAAPPSLACRGQRPLATRPARTDNWPPPEPPPRARQPPRPPPPPHGRHQRPQRPMAIEARRLSPPATTHRSPIPCPPAAPRIWRSPTLRPRLRPRPRMSPTAPPTIAVRWSPQRAVGRREAAAAPRPRRAPAPRFASSIPISPPAALPTWR